MTHIADMPGSSSSLADIDWCPPAARGWLWLARLLVRLTLAVTLWVAFAGFAGSAAAQTGGSCSGLAETDLLATALDAGVPEPAEQYLTCFPDGEGILAVRAKLQALRLDSDCRRLSASGSPGEVRDFILNNSEAFCAADLLERLQEIRRTFVSYDLTQLVGTPMARGARPDAGACEQACQGRETCKGYTFDTRDSSCTLWSAVTGRQPWGSARSGSTEPIAVNRPQPARQPQTSPSTPSASSTVEFVYSRNSDMPGGDYQTLREMTLATCQSMCLRDTSCRGFTYNANAEVCFLKDSIRNERAFNGAISARKIGSNGGGSGDAGQRGSAFGELMPGVELANPTQRDSDFSIRQVTNVDQCRQSCLAVPQCRAFTYALAPRLCVMKSGVELQRARIGTYSAYRLD